MHRTRLLLEDGQYESLRARAEREGTSLASLVREALAVYLTEERTAAERRLAEIEVSAATERPGAELDVGFRAEGFETVPPPSSSNGGMIYSLWLESQSEV